MSKHLIDSSMRQFSGLTCPSCGRDVKAEDFYCGSCGTNLLSDLPVLCGTCGMALVTEDTYCRSCGQLGPEARIHAAKIVPPTVAPETEIRESAHVPQASILPRDDLEKIGETSRARRVGRWYLAIVLILVAVAVATWLVVFRDSGTGPFETGSRKAFAIASDMQAATDSLDDPSELEGFGTEIQRFSLQLDNLRNQTRIEDAEQEARFEDLLDSQSAYVEELARLASLTSAAATEADFTRVGELASDVEEAMDTNTALLPTESTLAATPVTPTALIDALSRLAAYRENALKERAQIRAANQKRADELAEVQGSFDEVEGVLERYADARTSLSDWVEKVNSQGASFAEAYDVLGQHADLRRQLRDELAVLDVPEDLAANKSDFLSVLDSAIIAMDDATRGIDEYQFTWNYPSYDLTPGWRSFESATSRITDDFSNAYDAYNAKGKSHQRTEDKEALAAPPRLALFQRSNSLAKATIRSLATGIPIAAEVGITRR